MKIEDIEKLCDQATEGPWLVDKAVHIGTGIETLAIYSWPTEFHCTEIIESPDELNGECIHNENDAKFIAGSREFVPWACNKIRELGQRDVENYNYIMKLEAVAKAIKDCENEEWYLIGKLYENDKLNAVKQALWKLEKE